MYIKAMILVLGLLLNYSCSSYKIKPNSIKQSNQVEIGQLNLPKGVLASEVNWNVSKGEVSFIKNTSFSSSQNTDKDVEGFYWEVPKFIKRISIKKGVKIVGGFRLFSNVEIIGEERETCEIFGTNTKNWALGDDKEEHPESSCENGPKGDDICDDCDKWRYGAISVLGNNNITVIVKNITITNSRTYAITSFDPVLKIDNVHIRVLRTEPDWHSNSDGVSAGAGSYIKNSKIDVWDDAIKLYRDMEVENVTIIHNSNGAPFQLGWGDRIKYSSHKLKNVLIKMSNSKYYNLALFSASLNKGTYVRNINIKGIKAIYDDDLILPNKVPISLFYLKSDVAVNIKLSKDYPVLLKAPKFAFGFGIINVNGNTKKENLNLYSWGDSKEITGCGW